MVKSMQVLIKLKKIMDKKSLSENLKKLLVISNWFEEMKEVDIEEGLKKVKEAVAIIKNSRTQLQEIENEFEEIKNEVKKDISEK